MSAYAGDGSSEYAEFWREMELAQARYRVNQTMDFFVEASRGHDDYLMSLALMVRAAGSPPRTARGGWMTRRAWVGDCAGGGRGWRNVSSGSNVVEGERAAGGGEHGAGERVRGGWVFGVRGVLARDGAGAGAVPG